MHNYRLTFDIHQNNNPAGGFVNARFFEVAGRVWQQMGGEWGGAWTGFVDRPHMQFTDRLSLRNLQNGKTVANNARMPWENEVVEEEIEEPKGDNYMITRLNLTKNGKRISTNNIFHEGKNYVELRDYEESYGNVVEFDKILREVNVRDVQDITEVRFNIEGNKFEIDGEMRYNVNRVGARDLLENMGYQVTWEGGVVVGNIS